MKALAPAIFLGMSLLVVGCKGERAQEIRPEPAPQPVNQAPVVPAQDVEP